MNDNLIIKYSIITLAVAAVVFIPDVYFFSHDHSLCLHLNLLHYQCPLCGMTRAAHELVRFRVGNALHYNFNILFLPAYVFTDLLFIMTGRSIYHLLRRITTIGLMTGLVIIYVIRMGLHFGWFR